MLTLLRAALLASCLFAPVTGAFALSARSVAISPSSPSGKVLRGPGYFRVQVAPAINRRLYVRVANESGAAVTVDLDTVDAVRDIYGNLSYQLPGAPRLQVGRWLRLGASIIRLRPHEALAVPFTLWVPARTRPGTYVGALTATLPGSGVTRRGRAVLRVQMRLADAVVVTVHPPEHAAAPRSRP